MFLVGVDGSRLEITRVPHSSHHNSYLGAESMRQEGQAVVTGSLAILPQENFKGGVGFEEYELSSVLRRSQGEWKSLYSSHHEISGSVTENLLKKALNSSNAHYKSSLSPVLPRRCKAVKYQICYGNPDSKDDAETVQS